MAKSWHVSAEFKKRLARVPASVVKATNEAIEKNAAEWVKTSRSMAPTDPVDGVYLRPSIRHYESPTGGQIVRAGGEATTRPGKTGQPYDYAIAQEFGRHLMSANPFFWPAYRLLRKRMASRRRRAMNQAIKDINNGK